MVCLYGSTARPGAPNGFWLTLQGVLSFLPSALNGWLAWTPDWLDGAYVSTAQLCASPQPVVGAFPAADYLACQLSPLTQYGASCAVVRSWFNTYVRSLLWANQCQCNPASGCTNVVSGGPYFMTTTWTLQCSYAPIFSSGRSFTVAWTTRRNGATITPGIDLVPRCFANANGTGSFTDLPTQHPTYDALGTFTVTVPPGYLSVAMLLSLQGATDPTPRPDIAYTFTEPIPCVPTYESAPATPSQPSDIVSIPVGSCSATADLCAELLRLEQYVAELTATANYLTRQLAPYSYILGTPSSGLSGNGYISVTECLGVLVTLTTIPGTKGAQTGTPTRHFDVGRINWGDINGYHAHYPIHESPELIMGIPNTATRIGYTFPAGVVATITPLERT